MTPPAERDLGRIFAYDALDLEANTQGYLSDAQKHRLRHQIDHSRTAFIVAGTAGICLILGGYLLAGVTGLLIGVVMDGVLMGVAFLGYMRTQRILNGEVKMLEGRPIVGEKGDFRDTAEYAHVQFGKVVFRLPPHVASVFSERAYYRVYYLPNVNIMVAVEQI